MADTYGWASEGFSDVGGRRLAYLVAGEKSTLPSIIFVHGAAGSRKSWYLLLHDLQKRGLHGIALELPGHGASPGPGSRSIEDYAVTVNSFIEAGGLVSPVIAGHSMGGGVALTCGLSNQERLGGLILIGTGARLRVSENILDGILSDFSPTVTSIAGALFSPGALPALMEEGRRQLLECPAEIMHGDFSACDEYSVMDNLAGIELPALVLCGTNDLLTPPKYSQFLYENMPAASLEMIEDAGHMVMLEQPGRVGESIHRFVRSL
jgi:pimeloyl-ACP methyl ester carboxylesterase